MGFKKGGNDPAMEISKPSSSLSDALLFATMCIVGLPVEVKVRDGSVYSGIFHTACIEKGYGIILKKATKIGKGKWENNVAIGDLVDTLVVGSGDLVQVVVKDFILPAEGSIGNITGDGVEAAIGAVEAQNCNTDSNREPRNLDQNKEQGLFYGPTNNVLKVHEGLDVREVLLNPFEINQGTADGRIDSICPAKVKERSLATIVAVQERQVGKDVPQGEAVPCNHVEEVSSTNKYSCRSCFTKTPHEDDCEIPRSICQEHNGNEACGDTALKKNSNGPRCGSPAALLASPEAPKRTFPVSGNTHSSHAEASTDSTSVSDIRTSLCNSLSPSPDLPVTKENSVLNTRAKVFKLNPQAKVFSPSFVNHRSAPAVVPNITSTGYISSFPPVIPVAAAHSEVECSFGSIPSLPAKFLQYNGVVSGQSGVTAQYSRPIVGHAGVRQQPVRFSGQFHPVQPGPAYVHPTSPAVMVGRMGQLVYVQPIPQDAIQGTALSHGLPHPLFDPCQVNISKIQGSTPHSVQLCITPPLITGAAQPFAVPSPLPFSQPFPAVRSIPVPGGNGFLSSKFQ